MNFCPYCSNMLLITDTNQKGVLWFCKTCFYYSKVKKPVITQSSLKKKQIEPIFSTKHNLAKCEQVCPKCDHLEAYFFELQTRSADEPMTQFFQCCRCEYHWKIG